MNIEKIIPNAVSRMNTVLAKTPEEARPAVLFTLARAIASAVAAAEQVSQGANR